MAKVNPYLIFNGTCEAAFLHYETVFGTPIAYMGKFKDMPPAEATEPVAEEESNRVMHVVLPISAETLLMGSDSTSQQGAVSVGENVQISIDTSSQEEADRLFNGLAAGGKILMPMSKTFWGAYFGMCTDAFGVHWMVNFDE
ncbi:MAG: hypothetical protein RLZZ500_2080 [Bacteroidota bacterium]|jgi:PhnB protein